MICPRIFFFFFFFFFFKFFAAVTVVKGAFLVALPLQCDK